MTGIETVTAALQRIPLFDGVPEDQLTHLASTTLQQKYGRGQTIFSRGEPGDRAYVIMAGAIDLVIDSPDGRELILARLGTGEHFGEMALMDDLLRSATARTAAPTEVIVIFRQAFLQALVDHPDISRQIIRSLVRRLRVADEKLEAFAYLDVEGRISRSVLELSREREQPLHVSHEELAHMSAASRQTVTRVLGEWEGQGFVELSRRGIFVKDTEALALLAQL